MPDEAHFRSLAVTLVQLQIDFAILPPGVVDGPVDSARRQLHQDAFVEEVGRASTLFFHFRHADVERLKSRDRRQEEAIDEEEDVDG